MVLWQYCVFPWLLLVMGIICLIEIKNNVDIYSTEMTMFLKISFCTFETYVYDLYIFTYANHNMKQNK